MLKNIQTFFDKEIILNYLKQDEKIPSFKQNGQHPIVEFNNILIDTKKISEQSNDYNDEISVMKDFKTKLSSFSKRFNLDSKHFVIDNSGKTIVVKTSQGQHYILPTHFEKGSYFSSPHFDHQLNYLPEKVPKIHIGKYTRFGKGSVVNAGGDIYIGDYVWLAPGSTLLRQEHNAYGQPSIGSRTPLMTRQPGIHLADLSWIGRDAIVGWNCEYVGKSSIVGARSFINKWVGDYSIVGDHSKILSYLPVKAFLMEYYHPSIEEILQISNWENIYQEWQSFYVKNKVYQQKNIIVSPHNVPLTNKDCRVLIVNPSTSEMFSKFTRNSNIDIFLEDKLLTPFILQKAQNLNMSNVRVRQFNNIGRASVSSNQRVMGRETGYDMIIVPQNINDEYRYTLQAALKSDGIMVIENISERSVFWNKLSKIV